MLKIVLATGNKHKVREFKNIFEENGIEAEIIPISETGFKGEIIENADTFEGNAYIKAKTLCDYTGMTTIADDSGLCVDALGGAPGVYSSRYSGENADDMKNINKLLTELHKLGEVKRDARFECCICVCRKDDKKMTFTGRCEGKIIDELRGDGRFGYDPVFFYEPLKKTFAEMTSAEKDKVSHRGKAMEELIKNLSFISEK